MAQNRISKRSVAVVSLFLIVALGVFVLQPAIAHAYDTCLPMNQLGEKPDGDPDMPDDFTSGAKVVQQLDLSDKLVLTVRAMILTDNLVF